MYDDQVAGGRLTFTLRIVAVLFVLVAIACTWVGIEMRGRLIRMTDAECLRLYRVAPRNIPEVAIPESLSLHDFTARVLSILDEETPSHPFSRDDFHFDEYRGDHLRTVRYDFKKWRRQRLDIRRLEYILDHHDLIAQTRNDRVHEAIKAAAMAD